MMIIQAYASIVDAKEDEIWVKGFMIKFNLKLIECKQGVLLVTGDWNIKVRNSWKENVVGCYGLENRNEAENHLFLQSNDFFFHW